MELACRLATTGFLYPTGRAGHARLLYEVAMVGWALRLLPARRTSTRLVTAQPRFRSIKSAGIRSKTSRTFMGVSACVSAAQSQDISSWLLVTSNYCTWHAWVVRGGFRCSPLACLVL